MAKQKSDLSRAFSEDGALKTHVGGQALIEGVMMRGKYNWAVGVREPDGGIYEESHDLASGRKKNGWMYWPLVRGCRAMVESLILGYKALEVAAMHAYGEEPEAGGDSAGSVDSAEDSIEESSAARAEGSSPAPRSAAQGPSDPSCASLIHDFENNRNSVLRVTEDPSALAGEGGPDSSCSTSAASPVEGDSFADVFDSSASSFSWKDDFGWPDTVIDALGAQRSLEVVSEDAAGGEELLVAEPSGADAEGSSPAPRSAAQGPSDPSCASLIHDFENNRNSVLRAGEGPSAPAGSGGLDSNPSRPPAAKDAEEEAVFGKREMAFSMVLGLVMGVVLFIVAPAFITNLIVGEYDSNTLLWNVVDGVLRVAVFVFYIWLIGRMSDIKRMFGYHGAEHKTIHCYEHGLPLTPENARQFPRLHVRCGTAFLIMVMIIAILVYTITPLNGLIAALGVPDGAPKLVLVILTRIVLMPVIAGISYEITVRWAGSHPENPLVKVVLWPGMQMQYLTTNEPDDSMLECAIAAMQQVLEREELETAHAAAGSRAGEASEVVS